MEKYVEKYVCDECGKNCETTPDINEWAAHLLCEGCYKDKLIEKLADLLSLHVNKDAEQIIKRVKNLI